MSRDGHLHAACWSVCNWDQGVWSAKKSWLLDRSLLNLLIGQIAATRPWCIEFHSSEATLISSQKGFDRLISFWSWSQMLLHRTYMYKWLPFVRHCISVSQFSKQDTLQFNFITSEQSNLNKSSHPCNGAYLVWTSDLTQQFIHAAGPTLYKHAVLQCK